jgi:hypothetical protein
MYLYLGAQGQTCQELHSAAARQPGCARALALGLQNFLDKPPERPLPDEEVCALLVPPDLFQG